MKKTIPTSIAHTLFYLEEDAYNKLNEYLQSIREHFSNHEDNKEIIDEIESRIAEQCIEYVGGNEKKDKIITKEHIDKLITGMGSPDDFDDEKTNENKKEESYSPKTHKLYRNPNDAMIGGVAGGIAEYFDIDSTLVRFIFVISILFGGTGLLVYIILWIIVPEAKTASQKLEMRGKPITLETVSGAIKEKIEEVKNRNEKKSINSSNSKIGEFIRTIIRNVIPIIGKISGVIIMIGSIVAFISVMSLFLIGTTATYTAFPFLASVPFILYITFVLSVFFVFIVPIIFVMELGRIFFTRKIKMSSVVSTSLLSLWIVSLIAGIVMGFIMQRDFVDVNEIKDIIKNEKQFHYSNGQFIEIQK